MIVLGIVNEESSKRTGRRQCIGTSKVRNHSKVVVAFRMLMGEQGTAMQANKSTGRKRVDYKIGPALCRRDTHSGLIKRGRFASQALLLVLCQCRVRGLHLRASVCPSSSSNFLGIPPPRREPRSEVTPGQNLRAAGGGRGVRHGCKNTVRRNN